MHRLIRELRLKEFDRAVEGCGAVMLPRQLEGRFEFGPSVREIYIAGFEEVRVYTLGCPMRVFPLEGLWDEN